MARSKFKISEFTNPSGASAWRLSGTLNGKRIRENFKTRAEAVTQRQAYEVERLNGLSEGQTVWTTLTHEQNRDAIAAVNLLKESGVESSLVFAARYLLENYRPPEREKTVAQAVYEYMQLRIRDQSRSFISESQLKGIRSEMNWLKIVFGKRSISTISPEIFREYLESSKKHPRNRRPGPKVPSLKTWNNRRGLLNTFCKYCVERGYLTANPIDRVPQYKISRSRSTNETLKAERAADLMAFLEKYDGPDYKRASCKSEPGFLVPYFALALFAGVRPDWKDGEISKLGAEDIDYSTNVIRIEPAVSKVNEKRVIKMQPNLKLWLERYPFTEGTVVPSNNPDRILRDIRTKFGLGHDVLRHTYISMTVGAFRSVGDAALQAGNSESVIRRHYLDLKSAEEADEFWSIVPEGIELPPLEKKDGRYMSPKEEDASS